MPKGRAWTTEEEQFIRRNRQKMSVDTISSHLGRSVDSVEIHWRRMRKAGRAKGFLYNYPEGTKLCQKCLEKRFYVRDGICLICIRTEVLEKSEARVSDALSRLPSDQRSIYADHELHKGSRRVIPKKAPNTDGMSKKAQRKAEIQHEKEVEAAKIATIQRQINASKTRLKRIRLKLGENPRMNKENTEGK